MDYTKNNYMVDFLRHHLDDFLTLDPHTSSQCQQNLAICINASREWEVLLHSEGLATLLTVLPLKLDSESLQHRLPQDKFDCIVPALAELSGKQHCKQRELQLLMGH